MSLIQRGLLQLRSPFVEIKRFRSKIDLRRPRKPHFYKQTYFDLSEPFFDSKNLPRYEKCDNRKGFQFTKQENPFEHVLARECSNWFNNSKMVTFIHMNSITAYDKQRTMVALRREGMYLRTYGKKIVRLAVDGTPFEVVKKLFNGHTQLIFSEEIQASKIINILKKTPQFLIMAGIIDGRLLSRNEFIEYSQYPSLDILRSKLCNILVSGGVNLVSQMTQHQSALVNNLDEYVRINQSENNEEGSKDIETPATPVSEP